MRNWPVHKSMVGFVGRGMVGAARSVSLAALRLQWRFAGNPPYVIDGLTPAFLTDRMRQSGVLPNDVAIADISYDPIECGAIGDVYRARLRYTRSGASFPQTVIVKFIGATTKTVVLNALFGILEKEVLAYRTLGSHMQGLMPHCYVAEVHWTGAGVLVLEDLGDKRSIKSRHSDTLELRDAKTLFTLIGRIHGRSWEKAEIVDHFISRSEFNHVNGILPKMISGARRTHLGGAILQKPSIARTVEALMDRDYFEQMNREMRGHAMFNGETGRPTPFVLCHGDTRLDNTFFDDVHGRAILVDWQTPQIRHPICDLAWALIEVPSPMVATSLDELLQAYLDGVKQEAPGAQILSKSQLRDALPWGLVHTCFYWSVMLASVVHTSNSDDEGTNPLAFTISKVYASRLEALLERFVPPSFTERIPSANATDGHGSQRIPVKSESAYDGASS